MQSGGGDLQAALCMLPALHLFEIHLAGRPGVPYRIKTGLDNRQIGAAVQKFNGIRELALISSRQEGSGGFHAFAPVIEEIAHGLFKWDLWLPTRMFLEF